MVKNWIEVYRSIVLPSHCDHLGHMNVRYYAQHFDDGGFQMWDLIGIKQKDLKKGNMGTVVANISIDFINEIKAGQLILIKGGWTNIGRKSATHEQRLFETDSNTLCAKQTTVEVYFDMKKRKPAVFPEDIKNKVKSNLLPSTLLQKKK